MNQTSKFWDKIADRYSKQPVADEETLPIRFTPTPTRARMGANRI